jgi:hypothetical protein
MSKKINCKYCGMGHAPKADGNHWIVKSIVPARISIVECAYHKAGEVSPIALIKARAERENCK